MCKTRFKKIGTSGFSFPQINSFLGRTMDIDSILPVCSEEEEEMMATITEEEEGFRNDYVVDNWMQIYGLGKTILLKKWFAEDTQARGIGDASIPDATHGDASIPQPTQNRPEHPSYEELVDLVISMRKEIDVLKARVASLEEGGVAQEADDELAKEAEEEAVEGAEEEAVEGAEEEAVEGAEEEAVEGAEDVLTDRQEVGGIRQPKRKRTLEEYNPSPRITRAKAKGKRI